MDHPVKEAPSVIHRLTMGSPSEQKDALATYFSPSAAFIHPFCRVSSFSNVSIPLIGEINSRWVIWMIYRWYKILSPKISLDVSGVVFDQKSSTLYVSISQIFSVFFIPFYRANVSLTTILLLDHSPTTGKYTITSQEDLYQTTEFVKFFWPGGSSFVWLWQLMATVMCMAGALVFAPVTWLEQRVAVKEGKKSA